MAFETGYLADPARVGGGERYGNNNTIISFSKGNWTSVSVGRFARVTFNLLTPFDGSADPVVAGVVLRNVANSVESGVTLAPELFDHVEVLRQGMVTVDVKAGETEPDSFGAVYASNAGDDDDGLATSTNTDLETNCEFIRAVSPTVWLVRQK